LLKGTLLEKAAAEILISTGARDGWAMLGRIALVISLIGIVLLLDGCTKCGPFWDDWVQPQKSCRSDHL